MSQTLRLELSDEAYSALRRLAEAAGASPARWASDALERQFGAAGSVRTDAERQAARERFDRHLGEVDLGRATGSDNEGIDGDLAKAYAETHEGG